MGARGTRSGLVAPWAAAMAALLLAGPALAQPRGDLVDLSIEELANLEITSVSRRAEPLSDAAASIFVITGDDIRRSGARTLPEALRLAPNLQVARIDASQYAISARGFNNSIGNKLLVLVDGRTVYTPLFSGVFWDQQDVMLEDVERIEVISGPGATLWGANAVNGVINVITKAARDTQGGLVSASTGNRDSDVAFRYGGALGEAGHYRAYVRGSKLQNTRAAGGADVADGRDFGQAGFRADWRGGRDAVTLQGDLYDGTTEPRGVLRPIEMSGVNVLGRWTRALAGGSELSVQAYFDRTERDDAFLFQPRSDVFDLQFQHSLPHGAHRFLWGAGYRRAHDDIAPGFFFGFVPRSRGLDWANVFAQEELVLTPALTLTFGAKLESNDYSGVETLPSARLAWKLSQRALAWAALSRAVRAPARLDHDIRLPATQPPVFIAGGDQFDSEIADVLELGYRAQPTPTLTFSATAFLHKWDRLRSGQLPPAMVQNRIEGDTYGVEAWATWQASDVLRLSAGATTLRDDLAAEPGANDPEGPRALGNDPSSQWLLRAALTPVPNHEIDATVRRVGALPDPAVPQYTALDLRYGWRAARGLELSLTVRNALDPAHPEFNAAPGRSEIARSVFGAVRWDY
jgi:iron complex outermembrane receptor protein